MKDVKENPGTSTPLVQDDIAARVEEIAKRVMSGKSTLQMELDITDEQLEAIYAVGYNLYNQGKYDEAKKTFGFVLVMNPMAHRSWFALGSAYQMAGQLQLAATYYFLSTMTDDTRPEPYLHLAECLVALNDPEGAAENLEKAIGLAEGRKGAEQVKARAEVMLENLKKPGKGVSDHG